MKINFNVWHTTKGGGARYIFEVSNRLVEMDHDVTITAISGDHKWFPVKAKVNYVPIPKHLRWLKPLGVYTKYKFGRQLRLLDVWHIIHMLTLKGVNMDLARLYMNSMPECDVNVATFGYTVGPVYRSEKGIPFHYVQGYDPAIIDSKYERDIVFEAYHLPIRKLVVSSWLQKKILEVTGQKAFYVGSGVDTKIFKPAKNVKKEPYTVGATLRTARWKRCQDVIKTLNRVFKDIPDIKLLATGTKMDLEELEKMAGEKIKFKVELVNVNSDKELVEFYSRPSVFLYTPQEEGFGLPPLEAMACGTPVVTTDCKGVREYSKNRYNSFICKVGDVNNLSKSVIKILNDEKFARKMASNGVKTAGKWNWKKVAERLVDVFNKAMKEEN